MENIREQFLKACSEGNKERVEHIIFTKCYLLNPDDYHDGFYKACNSNYIEICKIISNTYDYRWEGYGTYNGESLLLACKKGYIEIIKYIIENKLIHQPYIRVGFGYLCEKGNEEIIDQMISYGVTYFDDGLASACKGGRLDIIEKMISYGATNFDNGLISASISGHIEIVKLMISKGATDFRSGFDSSCENGHIKIVELMISKGADDYDEGLRNACRCGHIDVVELMISKGADDFNGGLYSASCGGRLDLVKLMITKGATELNSSLVGACDNQHPKIVEILISKGATDLQRGFVAAQSVRNSKIVRILLSTSKIQVDDILRRSLDVMIRLNYSRNDLNIIDIMLSYKLKNGDDMTRYDLQNKLEEACLQKNIPVARLLSKYIKPTGYNKIFLRSLAYDNMFKVLIVTKNKIKNRNIQGVNKKIFQYIY